MAAYKRFEWTILNSAGEPVKGCSIHVRKQGGLVNGSGSLTTIPVHGVGAIIAGDTIAVDTAASPTASVSSVSGPSPMQVVVGSALTVTNDTSRLTVTSPLATIYNDSDATESISNPLLTDANGKAFCYARYDFVDALIASTAAGTAPSGPAGIQLLADWPGTGDGIAVSSVIDIVGGAVIAYIRDTVRALTNANSYIEQWLVQNVEKAHLTKDGTLALQGALTVNLGATVTGLINALGGFTLSGGALTLPAASITAAMLAANVVHPAPSTITGTSTDVVVGTSETVRLTTSYTPTSGNVGVRVTINIPYDIDGNTTNGAVEARLYIGGTFKAKGTFAIKAAGDQDALGTVSFTWEEPTMAASPTTIEVRDIKIAYKSSSAAVITYFGATAYPGYMTIQEFKK